MLRLRTIIAPLLAVSSLAACSLPGPDAAEHDLLGETNEALASTQVGEARKTIERLYNLASGNSTDAQIEALLTPAMVKYRNVFENYDKITCAQDVPAWFSIGEATRVGPIATFQVNMSFGSSQNTAFVTVQLVDAKVMSVHCGELKKLAEPSGGACVKGSSYCGGDVVAGEPSALYTCMKGHSGSFEKYCPAGCKVNPGAEDACK